MISELMALNESALQDEDGEFSDWVELLNLAKERVNLAGWYLTDDAGDLTKWELPDVWLEPGDYLVVFASGKDRFDPDGELHTNFRLGGEGEYLALVRPNGETVADAFEPTYPKQVRDTSYGLRFETTLFTAAGDPVQWLVPRDDSLGESWTALDFTPTEDWLTSRSGVGYGLADVQSAGELLVDLDAGVLAEGTSVTRWHNTGMLGDFSAQEAPPSVKMVGGVRAVVFDGLDDWMRSERTAPATITGNDDWSVEVWAFNAEIGVKETMLSWAKYDGPTGRTALLNYGSASGPGAVEHWGESVDMGYAGGPPAAGQWRHIVLTYAGGLGGLERLYVNGEVNTSKTSTLRIRGEAERRPFPCCSGHRPAERT